MKIKANSKKLQEKLLTATKYIEQKPVKPILGCLLLKVKNKTLTITATDGSTALITGMKVENEEGKETKTAMQPSYLTEILKSLREQTVTLEEDENTHKITLTTDNGTYTFPGQDADEFPEFNRLEDENAEKYETETKTLTEAVRKTIGSTSDDELHPVMKAICLKFKENGTLDVTATDGVRLSKVNIKGKEGLQGGCIIPKKSAERLLATMAGETGKVEMTYDLKRLMFRMPETAMVTLQQEGKYPQYESLLKEDGDIKVKANRKQMIKTLKAVQSCSNKSSNMIRMTIWNNMMKISAQDIDFATAGEETIQCEYEGEKFETGYKAGYLIENLSVMDSESVEMTMTDPLKPALIRPVQTTEGLDEMHLMMPMSLI